MKRFVSHKIICILTIGLVLGSSFMLVQADHPIDKMSFKNPTLKFSLDKVKMNVIKTADNGVVNHETIFLFSQKDDVVSAEYAGGKIRKGFLVGKFPKENQLAFSYCQMQSDGTLDNGVSLCELSKNENGKITLTEHFEWKSRPGEFGTNIFQEM